MEDLFQPHIEKEKGLKLHHHEDVHPVDDIAKAALLLLEKWLESQDLWLF